MTLLLVGLSVAVVGAIVVPDLWQRRHGTATARRRWQTLDRVTMGTSLVVFLGFQGAFGLFPEPAIPGAERVETALLVCSITAFVGAMLLRRRAAGEEESTE